MNKKQKLEKAIWIYMAASTFIDDKKENFSGKALNKLASIEGKVHKQIMTIIMKKPGYITKCGKHLEDIMLNMEVGEYSPLLVGLYLLSDSSEMLSSVSGFNLNFDEISSLSDNIIDQSKITTIQIKESSSVAMRLYDSMI